MRFRFGDFVLDADARRLMRGNLPIHLSPKAYELLALLVERSPEALSKSALTRSLWPDTFVVEANLSNLIGEIRAALGEDSRRARLVRTVQRFGYAVEGVEGTSTATPATRLTVFRLSWAGGRATLQEGENVLGRDPELSICIDATAVSRRHAQILVEVGEASLSDLGSKNGTFLNGRRIQTLERLADGDEIRLGSMRLRLRKLQPAASTETEAPDGE